MERFCQGTRPVSFTMVTDRLLAVGGVLGEADCVARRAFRGVADVIAGRKPARKMNRGEDSLSADNLAAMVLSQEVSIGCYLVVVVCDDLRLTYRSKAGCCSRAQELLQHRERKVGGTSLAAIGAGLGTPPRQQSSSGMLNTISRP